MTKQPALCPICQCNEYEFKVTFVLCTICNTRIPMWLWPALMAQAAIKRGMYWCGLEWNKKQKRAIKAFLAAQELTDGKRHTP